MDSLQNTPTRGFEVVRDNTSEHNRGRVHRGTRARPVGSSSLVNRRRVFVTVVLYSSKR